MRDSERFTVDDPRFTTARVVGPSMLSLDGAEHRRHRAPFVEPFRRGPIHARFEGAVEAETDRLLDEVEPRGAAELRTELAGPLAATIAAASLGLDVPAARVLGWYREIVAAVTTATAGEEIPTEGAAAFEELAKAVAGGLEAGGAEGPLRAAVTAGDLSPGEVASNAAVLLFGGIETTEGMIANVLMHLLSEPAELAAVLEDSALVSAAVEESLRLEPAAATVDRYATKAMAFGGAEIGERDLVVVSIAAANRDPATFAEPDRFVLDRPNRARHLAFAAGPHVCLGLHLARLEAVTAVDRVLRRLPGLRLDSKHDRPAARGLVFRKPPALHAVWG